MVQGSPLVFSSGLLVCRELTRFTLNSRSCLQVGNCFVALKVVTLGQVRSPRESNKLGFHQYRLRNAKPLEKQSTMYPTDWLPPSSHVSFLAAHNYSAEV